MADLEAGVGTVSRLKPGNVDRLVVVVEPSAKSVEVGRRAVAIAAEVGIRAVTVVVNRIEDPDDLEWAAAKLADVIVLGVPDDPEVLEADKRGLAPIDHAPASRAVTAIGGVAAAITGGG